MSSDELPSERSSAFEQRVRGHVRRRQERLRGEAAAPGSLVRSVAFRQAVFYVVVFSACVLILFGFFYWSTAGFLTRQAEATIEAEISGLAERYRNAGLAGLTGLINQRLSREPVGSSIYLLAGPDFEPLVGNISGWPAVEPDDDGWISFRLGDQGSRQGTEVRRASAKVFRLEGGFLLLVGRDMQELEAVRDTVISAVSWGLGFTVLMALVGGALMGRSLSNRVRDVNQAIRQIMAGDLSRRMPSRDSGDEFDQLTDNLNRMLDEIERLMNGVRQVSDNIAHDLKTPLARLRNRLDELRRGIGAAGGVPEGGRDAVEDAIDEADRLLVTFNALLRIARIEAIALREQFADVELGPLVADVAALYEPLAEERGQQIAVEVADRAVVHGDRDLIFQAVANVVDNAIKYAPQRGRVGISVAAEEAAALLTVTDDGPGIPSADRDKVFERFWRGDDSRSSPGSGLGLSLVDVVARLHDARVELADNNPGLRVTLRFESAAKPI